MYPIRVEKNFSFDIQTLLDPIPGDDPAGESLRYEGTYDHIKEARMEDDPVLSRGVWKTPLKRAEWSSVAEMCVDALQNRTKDLQIAAYLTEAWVHLYGFDGLRDGLRTMAALCANYWVELHPRAEGDDAVEYRFAAIDWVDEKMASAIRLLPLSEPQSDDAKPYCWDDWERIMRPGSVPTQNQAATQAQFQGSVLLTPTEFYSGLLRSVESAADACSELEGALEEQVGSGAPSLRQMANTMDSIRNLIVSILNQRETGPAEPAPAQLSHAAAAAPAESGGGEGEPPQPGGNIRSRAEAYRRLAEAADYLSRTEPHSPTPYLVRRAIAWGGMRLEDLLAELVRNGGELTEIYRLLQIPKAPGK